MRNRRLKDMLRIAVMSDIRVGRYLLDCYMRKTIRKDYSYAITTRINTDYNTFVLEVDETMDDSHEGKRPRSDRQEPRSGR